MHGKTSPVYHDGRELFQGLANPFDATANTPCSSSGQPAGRPGDQAWTADEEIMGVRHRELPLWGCSSTRSRS